MSAFWPDWFWVEMVTPMMAMRNSQTDIKAAPQRRSGRRPNFSIPHIPGRVMNTFTMFVATPTKKGFEMPEFVKKVTPSTRNR